MQDNSFFDESKERSQVKTRIVEKYFWAWAKVIISAVKKRKKNKIGYVDLFAGRGRYEDGTDSTPLLVLKKASEDDDIRNMLVSVFNDMNPEHVQDLRDAIDSSPEVSMLKWKPRVINREVNEELAKDFESMKTIPTLFFVDPFGYKGLSRQLISSLIKNWGCDCIFFFNYNRISMGINNKAVEGHMVALFGKERVDELQNLPPMRSSDRELFIIDSISQSLKEKAGQYVLPFRFKDDRGTRSSHHLIFVSKHRKGYEIMKEIMAKESTNLDEGVPSFEYNPATHHQSFLFQYSRPLEDLADMLMEYFAGKTVTVKQILDQHYNRFSVGTRYIEKSYKECLTKLEVDGKIQAEPPASKRQKRKGNVTFGPSVKVTFPPREGPQNGDQIQN